jgi:hypothetical protein
LSGYWVSSEKEIENAENLMTADSSNSFRSLENQWISSETYGTIFKNNVIIPNDPELLVLGGFIHKDGTVEFLDSGYLAAGFETGVVDGEDSLVQVKDSDGNVTSAASFNTSFYVELQTEDGSPKILESDIAPFVVKVPIGPNAATVEILSEGIKVAEYIPRGALFVDTIKAISQYAFKRNVDKSRKYLLRLASVIDNFEEKCQLHEKREKCLQKKLKLSFKLREFSNRLLNDSIQKSDPSDLSKEETLREIDNIILKIIPDRTIYDRKKEHTINLLPFDSNCRKDKLFIVNGFTQGEFGRVTMSKHGDITYRPNTLRPFEDSFEVTIRNSWGLEAVKKIKIISGKP